MPKNSQSAQSAAQPESTTGKAGVIVAADNDGSMEKLAHSVVDDVLYNIIHDLLLKVHRDEKQAKAATAAIRIEKLAAGASDSSTADSRPEIRFDTDFATYEDGKVMLKGNPLEKVKDILCPRCHLPRLLHPTDGKGARKPDPGVIYCKKHPYIEKPGFDIYGQTWVPPGPGRGKKKKDMKPDPLLEAAGDGEGGTGTGKGGAASRPPNVLSFPSATCSKCKRCILVSRLNNHMGSCIGNSGRNASRAAAEKLKNGGSGNGEGTPPSSQKGTPLPGSRAASPRKRDTDEMLQDGEDDDDTASKGHPKKKKLKTNPSTPVPAAASLPGGTPTTLTKKVIIKNKGALGAAGPKKVKTASNLSVESKVDDADDYKPPSSQGAERKRAGSSQPPVKAGSEVKETQVPPPAIPPPSLSAGTALSKSNIPIPAPKKKLSTTKIPSPAKKLKLNGPSKPPLPPGGAKKKKPGAKESGAPDASSESSGPLSSPPIP